MAFHRSGLSVYVHVPFCTDKCLYCDFYSVPHLGVSASLQSAVVEQTLAQARTLLALAGPAARIETVFVGGGTPSVLAPSQLESLLGLFRGLGCAEWTVEANPESVSERFLGTCGDSGVTRLSLGIQTLGAAHLKLLRRSASRETTLRGAALAAKHWKGELNLDFIAGIPGQTVEEIRQDLAILDSTGPGHVSLYQLTCEPGTPLAALVDSGEITLNPPPRDEELWFAGRDELVRRGYRHYEISNFCLPGRECRHNLRYWSIDPYLGVGPGAVSTLPGELLRSLVPAGDAPGLIARVTNPKDLASFARGRDALWGMDMETISPRDFLLETLMMGLRVDSGIGRAVFERRFGAGLDELFPGMWTRWLGAGLASPVTDRIALTAQGRMLLDGLMGEAVGALADDAAGRLRLAWP